MAVLYLAEQGATLRKQNDTLVLTKDNDTLTIIPAIKVDQIVIFGNINITTPVINYLLDTGKDCAFCSSSGKYHGRLFSTESKWGLLRRAQYQASTNETFRLHIAREMIRGKFTNSRTFLQRYQRKEPKPEIQQAIDALETVLSKINQAEDIPGLLGIEGYGSSVYFSVFRQILKQDIGFYGRARRPPPDPVNSLLSLGYTLLVYDAQAAIRIVGLDPFIGMLHATEYSKPSLALDLIEEFRTVIVESIVTRVLNNNIIKAEDFERDLEKGGMMRLKQDALKKYIQYYEERMLTEIIYPLHNHRIHYRRCLELQARQIARLVTTQQGIYVPYIVK